MREVRKIEISSLLLQVIIFALIFMQIVLTIWEIRIIVSVINYSLIGVIFINFLLISKKKYKSKMESLLLLLAIIICLWSVGAAYYSNPKIVVSMLYLRKPLFFCVTVLNFYNCYCLSMSENKEKLRNIFLYINCLLAIVFGVAVIMGKQQNIDIYAGEVGWIFGYSNPNMTAMIIGMILISIIYFLFEEKSVFYKLIAVPLAVIMAFCLYETRSRNVFLACGAFFAFYVIVRLFINSKIRKVLIVLGILVPGLFVLLYLLIANTSISNMIVAGKPLDSRVVVYMRIIRGILQRPFMGSFFSFHGESGALVGMFNTFLDLWASFGGIVLLLTILYFCTGAVNVFHDFSCSATCLACCGFLAMWFMGIGESALLTSMALSIWLSGFLLLSGNDNRREKNNETGICL